MTEFNRIETDYFEALQYYENDDKVSIELWPGSDFVGHLKIVIRGREKTPYEGGRFLFEMKAFENYPFYPPGVFCHTKIWHPNIDIDKPAPTDDLWKDNVCFDIINPERIGKVDPVSHASGWTPAKDLTMIFECLKLMIHCYPPFFNADDPLNLDAGYQYKEVRGVFRRKAAGWTRKYALTGGLADPDIRVEESGEEVLYFEVEEVEVEAGEGTTGGTDEAVNWDDDIIEGDGKGNEGTPDGTGDEATDSTGDSDWDEDGTDGADDDEWTENGDNAVDEDMEIEWEE